MTMLPTGDILVFLALLAFVSVLVWLARKPMPRFAAIALKGLASLAVLWVTVGSALGVFSLLPVNNDSAERPLGWRSLAYNGALLVFVIAVLVPVFRLIWRSPGRPREPFSPSGGGTS